MYLNDTGWDLEIEVLQAGGGSPLNISTASAKAYVLTSPGGRTYSIEVDFKTDGSDGMLTYEVDADTFDEAGSWTIRAAVTLPALGTRYTETDTLVIGA